MYIQIKTLHCFPTCEVMYVYAYGAPICACVSIKYLIFSIVGIRSQFVEKEEEEEDHF